MAISKDKLKNLSVEELKMLMDSGLIDQKQARIALKLKEAKAVRGEKSIKGTRGIGRGNIYVSASPLEHLAQGIRKYKSKGEIEGLEEEQVTLDEEDSLAREKFWEIRQGERDEGGAGTGNYTQQMGPPTVEQDAPEAGQLLEQAPQPNIPNLQPDFPQDQFAIGAEGDTSRDIGGRRGVVTVGDIPPPGGAPAPPGAPPAAGGFHPPMALPPMQGPPAPKRKTAQELYAEALRGLTGNVPQGGQGVY